MHRIIDSPKDVVAVKISGKITLDDLKAIMDRLDEAMAGSEKVHVFAETESIEGMELSAMPEHMRRAFPLFGKLNRFGRVAVVADQAWVRAGTRLARTSSAHDCRCDRAPPGVPRFARALRR